jgi:hypothetical protein
MQMHCLGLLTLWELLTKETAGILHILHVAHAHTSSLSITDAALMHTAHDLVLKVNVLLWSSGADGVLVAEDENVVVLTEQTVDILESSTGCLWVEEVDDWNEGGVEDGPDDVELPLEVLNTDWSDLL